MHHWALCWTWFAFTTTGRSKRKEVKSFYESMVPLIHSLGKLEQQEVFPELLNYSWVVLPFGSAIQGLCQRFRWPLKPKKPFLFFNKLGQGYISYQISRNCTGSTYLLFSCARSARKIGIFQRWKGWPFEKRLYLHAQPHHLSAFLQRIITAQLLHKYFPKVWEFVQQWFRSLWIVAQIVGRKRETEIMFKPITLTYWREVAKTTAV